MKITLTDKNEIVLTAEQLSSFAAKKVRKSIPFTISKRVPVDADLITPLSYKVIKDGEIFIITSRHDGIYTNSAGCTVERIKAVKKVSSASSPLADSLFLAEAFITAYLTSRVKNLSQVTLRITLQGENGEKSFDFDTKYSFLSLIFDSLLTRAAPFAKIIKEYELNAGRYIAEMPFPYTSIRDGQKDFINETYRTIKRGKRLIASAPTGIGKTVSALFPAVKALGDGLAEKIFYLTAKSITGKNALDTVRAINRHVPNLRAIAITAKERTCPAKDKKNPFVRERCDRSCPRLCDGDSSSYIDRRYRALTKLLTQKTVYDTSDINSAAEEFYLCPYELSLDLSEYCQVIVCDYNYVFDTRVRFRRYFTEGDLKYILLADEAHNLPDRAREMYFAHLTEGEFLRLSEKIKRNIPNEGRLLTLVEKIFPCFATIRERCLENSDIYSGENYGYFIDGALEKGFTEPFYELAKELRQVCHDCDIEDVVSVAERVLSDISDLAHAEEFFDEHFVFFGEAHGDSTAFKLICLDASNILNTIMSSAVSSVLFSATLTPLDYFADILGCRNATTLELDSPYDPDNLCIAAVDTVSTKLSARENTARSIAELILCAVSEQRGNYLVYFPSYKYMKSIVKEFLDIAPRDIRAVMQKPDMSISSREKFLSFFTDKQGGTLVGFCVLGGIFSEGIDLPNEKLIGAILVGVGLPGLSSELNILKDYYDRTREDGYNFAYVYPGMIKVLQAAGRVIRGESDRGIVVLLDERYADPAIRKIFPAHWKNMRYVGNTRSLSAYLKSFWKNKQ